VPPLILASRSPQRRALLEQLGIEFTVEPPGVTELESGPPEHVAAENARRKAAAVAARHHDERVLGVDTVVCLDGRLYGKPADAAQARATIEALAGRRHDVVSGVCLMQGAGEAQVAAATTHVRFRDLDRATIAWYVDSGEWRERAGGYAIQGRGAALVAAIEGDYSNVVGLPINLLLQLAPEILTVP
jgi:septum formation protein